jgi:hypothetical protein
MMRPEEWEFAAYGALRFTARRHYRSICAAQQVRELGRVGHRIISEAVVYARPSAVLTCECAVRFKRPAEVIGTSLGKGSLYCRHEVGFQRRRDRDRGAGLLRVFGAVVV